MLTIGAPIMIVWPMPEAQAVRGSAHGHHGAGVLPRDEPHPLADPARGQIVHAGRVPVVRGVAEVGRVGRRLDDVGQDLGGVIAPGINLSIEALQKATARLPRIGIGRPQAVIGRSTIPAMQSGIYWGDVGLSEGLVARMRAGWDGEQ